MKDWRQQSVLICGCGSIGKRHARVLSSLGVRDIRILDTSPIQRASLKSEVPSAKEFCDYAAALAGNPEAVFICTPSAIHIPMTVAALEGGAAVLCEKPLAADLTDLSLLENALKKTSRPFTVAFCFRYHEALTEAKRLIDAGGIGKVRTLRLRMSENLAEVRPDYKSLVTLHSGGVYDLTHELDLAFWFAGQEGNLSDLQILDGVVGDLGFTSPDFASLSFRLSNGVYAQIYLDYFSVPRTRVTEIMGSEGTVKIEFADWNEAFLSVYQKESGDWMTRKISTERDFMFRREDEDFLRLSAGEAGTPACSFSEAVKSLEILDRAEKRHAETEVSKK